MRIATFVSTSFLYIVAMPLAIAFENFITNPTQVYPSGCATLLQMPESLQGNKQLLIPTAVLPLWDTDAGIQVPTEVTVYRMGCPETNRSVVLIEIRVTEVIDGIQSTVRVPYPAARINGVVYPMRLEAEPNVHLVQEATSILEGGTYIFFLDGPALNQFLFGYDNYISPDQYNGQFEILLADPVTYDGTFQGYTNTIPAYAGSLASSTMPITGRHSGNWVALGAVDQGMLISFNELVSGGDILSLVFLSWYTFDQDGNLLWLTGAATYTLGDHSVSLSLDLVEDGEFMGLKPATRSNAGSVTLTAVSCQELRMEYNLSPLGLGSSVVILTRVFKVEIAGYACADLQSRIN